MTKTIYEVYNNTSVIPFATENEANEYIQGTNLGFQIRSKDIDTTEPSLYEQKFYKDLAFGKSLVEKFLIDNRNLATAFTDAQNLVLLQKFAPIQTLCLSGVITTAKSMLANVVIDEIFTQDRKDAYLLLMENYISENQ